MNTRRLFFALWPDQAMREALAAAVRDAMSALRGGRPVPLENLHVTLAFLGSVPEASLPVLAELARELSRQPGSARERYTAAGRFEVTLDTIEYWRRAQLLCAAASREPAGTAALAAELRAALSAAGFRSDLKPFRAHVTLARQVRHVSPDMRKRRDVGAPPGVRTPTDRRMPPVTWTFDEFALVESRTLPEGSSYSIVGSWALCRPPRGDICRAGERGIAAAQRAPPAAPQRR